MHTHILTSVRHNLKQVWLEQLIHMLVLLVPNALLSQFALHFSILGFTFLKLLHFSLRKFKIVHFWMVAISCGCYKYIYMCKYIYTHKNPYFMAASYRCYIWKHRWYYQEKKMVWLWCCSVLFVCILFSFSIVHRLLEIVLIFVPPPYLNIWK